MPTVLLILCSVIFWQKLKRRVQSLNALEKDTEKAKALHSTLISSDDSDGENDIVLVRSLPWRAEELGTLDLRSKI